MRPPAYPHIADTQRRSANRPELSKLLGREHTAKTFKNWPHIRTMNRAQPRLMATFASICDPHCGAKRPRRPECTSEALRLNYVHFLILSNVQRVNACKCPEFGSETHSQKNRSKSFFAMFWHALETLKCDPAWRTGTQTSQVIEFFKVRLFDLNILIL